LKDLIAPKKCYSCKKEWHFLCEECFFKIEKHYFFDEICYICKKHSKNFLVHEKCKKEIYYDKTIILTHYKIKIIKKLIKDAKFYYKKEILDEFSEFLIEKMIKYMKEELKTFKKQDFIIIPTPMTFLKKLIRWYNQTEILAKNIAKNFDFKYEKNLILKTRHTRQQSLLSRQKRLQNLKKSFKINKKIVDIVDKKIVILVDDVISTWTTVNEISKILKKFWAQKVIVITIASWY